MKNITKSESIQEGKNRSRFWLKKNLKNTEKNGEFFI